MDNPVKKAYKVVFLSTRTCLKSFSLVRINMKNLTLSSTSVQKLPHLISEKFSLELQALPLPLRPHPDLVIALSTASHKQLSEQSFKIKVHL